MITSQSSTADDACWAVGVNLGTPHEQRESVVSVAEQPAGAVERKAQQLSSEDFLQKSREHRLILEGTAGANLESRHSLIFYADTQVIGQDPAVTVPIERIEKVELLESQPIPNTPLNLPSMWRVRLELAPTLAKKALLDTVFES